MKKFLILFIFASSWAHALSPKVSVLQETELTSQLKQQYFSTVKFQNDLNEITKFSIDSIGIDPKLDELEIILKDTSAKKNPSRNGRYDPATKTISLTFYDNNEVDLRASIAHEFGHHLLHLVFLKNTQQKESYLRYLELYARPTAAPTPNMSRTELAMLEKNQDNFMKAVKELQPFINHVNQVGLPYQELLADLIPLCVLKMTRIVDRDWSNITAVDEPSAHDFFHPVRKYLWENYFSAANKPVSNEELFADIAAYYINRFDDLYGQGHSLDQRQENASLTENIHRIYHAP